MEDILDEFEIDVLEELTTRMFGVLNNLQDFGMSYSPERMEEIIVSLFIQCLNNHAADDCDWEEERENIISRTNEEKWKNHARMIVAHVIKQERDVAAYATAWV